MRGGRGTEPQSGLFLFRGRQEARGFNRVGEEEGGADADEDGDYPLNDEYIPPAFEPSSRSDGVEAAGEEAAKCTGERGCRVEDADTEGEFLSAVKVREV